MPVWTDSAAIDPHLRPTMYTPSHFAPPSTAALHSLVRAHPLGMLVTSGPQGLDANHLPFWLDDSAAPAGRLIAHVARANPVWQQADGAEVMVVFRGPQAYISPSWYPSKHATHRLVPTWNYEVVHAHGRLTVHDDARFVRQVMARLTHTHEASEAQPWKMGDLAPGALEPLVQAVVGIAVEITRLEGKSKLSQNRSAGDVAGAVQALQARGHGDLAAAMAQAAPPQP